MFDWLKPTPDRPIHTFGTDPLSRTPRGDLTSRRITLLLFAVALVAVLATLGTIAGVAAYARAQTTPTVRAIPAYVRPADGSTAAPAAPQLGYPNRYQQQDEACKQLGYNSAQTLGSGCR